MRETAGNWKLIPSTVTMLQTITARIGWLKSHQLDAKSKEKVWKGIGLCVALTCFPTENYLLLEETEWVTLQWRNCTAPWLGLEHPGTDRVSTRSLQSQPLGKDIRSLLLHLPRTAYSKLIIRETSDETPHEDCCFKQEKQNCILQQHSHHRR